MYDTVHSTIQLKYFRKPNNEDSQGRTSGNLEWRLARSEIQSYEPYTWIVDQVPQNYVTIKYSSSLDVYELSYDDDVKVSLKGWSAGAYYIENVFRKEETDWKMVYLCRTGKYCNLVNEFIVKHF